MDSSNFSLTKSINLICLDAIYSNNNDNGGIIKYFNGILLVKLKKSKVPLKFIIEWMQRSYHEDNYHQTQWISASVGSFFIACNVFIRVISS